MKKQILFLVLISFTLNFSSFLFSQNNLSKWRAQLSDKKHRINNITIELGKVRKELEQITIEFENAKKDRIYKKNIYDKTKDAFNRGSKNADIISPDDLVKLLKEYQAANKDHRKAQDIEKKLENQKNRLEEKIERLKKQKYETEIEILNIKAEMFDEEISKPVWSEGYGESILDEDTTMKECKRLALEYAKRDAVNKGSKTIIESLTHMEDFKLIKDSIKAKAKVQIIEQDNSGDYGKAVRVDHGDIIKFNAKVRLKLQSADTYNPYRKRIQELTAIEDFRTNAQKGNYEIQLTSFIRGAMDPAIHQMNDGSIWIVGHYAKDWEPFYIVSYDKGRTWSSPVLLWEEACYDIDLSQGKDGRIWVAWSSSVPAPYDPVFRTSIDGGNTWSKVRKLSVPPNHDTVMSIVFVSFSETWLCWEGGYISSKNSGQTWGVVQNMPKFGWNNATFNYTRDGRLWVVTVIGGYYVQIQWSKDFGRNWSSPTKVANLDRTKSKSREPIRPVARLIEDSNGRLWLAWYAYTSSTKSSQVWFSKSIDAGITWSVPTQITNDESYHGNYFSNISLAEVNRKIWIVYSSDKSGIWQIYRTIVGGRIGMNKN